MVNVDNPQITCLEWCAGYGGIHLGLKRAIPNLRTIAFGEIEAFACANLVAKMEAGLLDSAPVWTDIKTFPCEQFRDRVDILVAGYPCQPFSAEGKRLGADDPRHLWPHIRRSIGIIQPRFCFFENVEGHISLGLSTVISDLEEDGYRATWSIFSASEVGAPHQRKRVFILAYRDGERGQLPDRRELATEQVPVSNGTARGNVWPSRPGEHQRGWEPPRTIVDDPSMLRSGKTTDGCRQAPPGVDASSDQVVGNPSIRQDNGRKPGNLAETQGCGERGDDAVDSPGESMGDTTRELFNGSRPSTEQDRFAEYPDTGCRQTKPALGRDPHWFADGLDLPELSGLGDSELAEIYSWMERCDNRTDELRLLGNGVVPDTAELAWRTLYDELMEDA